MERAKIVLEKTSTFLDAGGSGKNYLIIRFAADAAFILLWITWAGIHKSIVQNQLCPVLYDQSKCSQLAFGAFASEAWNLLLLASLGIIYAALWALLGRGVKQQAPDKVDFWTTAAIYLLIVHAYITLLWSISSIFMGIGAFVIVGGLSLLVTLVVAVRLLVLRHRRGKAQLQRQEQQQRPAVVSL